MHRFHQLGHAKHHVIDQSHHTHSVFCWDACDAFQALADILSNIGAVSLVSPC
jgi:hypothetical protein